MENPPRSSVGRAESQIDPWCVLIDRICAELTSDELETVLFNIDQSDDVDDEDEGIAMETELKTEGQRSVEELFRRKMTDGTDIEDKTRRLKEVFDDLSYHTDGVKMSKWMDDFLMEYCPRISMDVKHFVGRDKEVGMMVKKLREKRTKFFTIHGIGGQGKTSLAERICIQLNWVTYRADMRDIRFTSDMMKALLLDAGQHISTSDDQLMKDFTKFLCKQKVPTLLFVDDCDMLVMEDRDKFYRKLREILLALQSENNEVFFLFTSRVKFDTKKIAGSDIYQCEIDSLLKTDAIDLLCQSAGQVGEQIPHLQAEEIVTECACSPLAITTVASLLREGKFTVEKLLFHLKMDKKNVTKALKIDQCIKTTINNLTEEDRQMLISLTVFQAHSFDREMAKKVCSGGQTFDEVMSKLCNYHLVDCHSFDLKFNNRETDTTETFSLHALVYKYTQEWRPKPKKLDEAFNAATKKFIELYERKISEIVFKMDTKCTKAMKMLELHKSHIMKFYSLHENKKAILEPYPKQSRQRDFLRKKRISDLTDLILPDVQKRRLFKSEAQRAIDSYNDAMFIFWTVEEANMYVRICDKPSVAMDLLDKLSDGKNPEAQRALDSQNDAMFIFWTVEEADVYMMLCDKPTVAMDLLDKLSDGKYPALRGLHADHFYPHLVHSMFHKVKGVTFWKQLQHERGLEHLQVSLKFLDHFNDNANYKNYRAKLYCYIGLVYIEMERIDEALESLNKGYNIVRGLIVKKDDDAQLDIPRYLGYFGLVYCKKGQREQDPRTKREWLDKAMEYLMKGMDLDRKLKLDHLDGYAMKRKVKADVLIERRKYDEALEEADAALNQRRAIIQPPHFKYAESVHQVAKIYMLKGNELRDNGKLDEARNFWQTSRDYFTEMEDHHLVNGSITMNHPLYCEIRRDHFEVSRLYDGDNSEEFKKLIEFYKKLEAGHFKSRADSHLKSFMSMTQTVKEFLQRTFGFGGTSFGEREVTIQQQEHAANQIEQMLDGQYGIDRKDSGHESTSSDLTRSSGQGSSGDGSLSHRLGDLQLEKSIAIEDEVFQASQEKRTLKRQKTVNE